MNPEQKLATLREYERIHLADMEDAARRGEEILLREVYTPKKDRIRKYADTLAERIDLKDPLLDITEKKYISTYIKTKYSEYGIPHSITNHINRDLPDEYINKDMAREQLVTTNGDQMVADLPEVKKLDNLRLQEEDEKLAKEESELRAKLARVRDVKAIVQEEASERHLSLPSMRSQVISTPKIVEDPEAVKLVEQLAKLCADKSQQLKNEFTRVLVGEAVVSLLRAASRTVEYPAERDDARRYINAARVYADVLDPLGDLKDTKDHKGWLETIKTFEEYGKHAAAVKNAIQTPSGVNRPLTREQVGDKALEVIEGAIAMYNTDPLLVALAEHHRKYKEPRIAERKVNLHDRLSEQA